MTFFKIQGGMKFQLFIRKKCMFTMQAIYNSKTSLDTMFEFLAAVRGFHIYRDIKGPS